MPSDLLVGAAVVGAAAAILVEGQGVPGALVAAVEAAAAVETGPLSCLDP